MITDDKLKELEGESPQAKLLVDEIRRLRSTLDYMATRVEHLLRAIELVRG